MVVGRSRRSTMSFISEHHQSGSQLCWSHPANCLSALTGWMAGLAAYDGPVQMASQLSGLPNHQHDPQHRLVSFLMCTTTKVTVTFVAAIIVC